VSVSVSCDPAAPVAVQDFCVVSVEEADNNDASAYDDEVYPTEPEVRYYLTAELGGDELLRSHVFSTNADGTHEWINVLFPEAGSWSVVLRDASDDSSVASASVTVS